MSSRSDLRQFVRFRPGRAMHDDGGSFLLQQISRVERRRLRHDHRHRDVEEATGIGDGKPGIAAGGGNKAALALTLIFLAGCPDAAQLEGARRLQRLEFQPDAFACNKAEPAGLEERGVQMEGHRRVLSCAGCRSLLARRRLRAAGSSGQPGSHRRRPAQRRRAISAAPHQA